MDRSLVRALSETVIKALIMLRSSNSVTDTAYWPLSYELGHNGISAALWHEQHVGSTDWIRVVDVSNN